MFLLILLGASQMHKQRTFDSWCQLRGRVTLTKDPFVSSFPKAPPTLQPFCLSFSHLLICRSMAILAAMSLRHWSEYIVGRDTHHSQRLFQRADWLAAFPPGQSYFHRHMQRKNTAPVVKSILLYLNVPKFFTFSSLSLNAPFLQHILGLLSQKHRGVCEGLMGICQSCTKDNWEQRCATIFIRSSCAIMISAHYFYHPDSSATSVAPEGRCLIWTS